MATDHENRPGNFDSEAIPPFWLRDDEEGKQLLDVRVVKVAEENWPWAFRLARSELRDGAVSAGSPEIAGDEHSGLKPAKSFAAAAWAVAVADVSMSLDNVLAVAGAARDHPGILIVGLIFAVALMGVAANIIAKYIERYRWIAYLGLAVIVYVAFKMIYEGWIDPSVGIGTLFG